MNHKHRCPYLLKCAAFIRRSRTFCEYQIVGSDMRFRCIRYSAHRLLYFRVRSVLRGVCARRTLSQVATEHDALLINYYVAFSFWRRVSLFKSKYNNALTTLLWELSYKWMYDLVKCADRWEVTYIVRKYRPGIKRTVIYFVKKKKNTIPIPPLLRLSTI